MPTYQTTFNVQSILKEFPIDVYREVSGFMDFQIKAATNPTLAATEIANLKKSRNTLEPLAEENTHIDENK